MKTIRSIGFAVLLIMMVEPAVAQRRRMNPSTMAQRQFQQMEQIIPSLTKQQKDQLQQIFTVHADSVFKVFNNQSLDRKTRFSQMRAMRTTLDNQLKTVLTAEQYKSYEDRIQNMRRQRRRN